MKAKSTNTIGRGINANRATLNAQVIDFRAYWVKAYKSEGLALLNSIKDALKVARESEDAKVVKAITEDRVAMELVFSKAKAITLTAEESVALKEMHGCGLRITDISANFLLENLAGTEWMNENGELLKKNSKKKIEAGEATYVVVTKWTPMQFGRYIRLAYDAMVQKNATYENSLR